MAVKDTVIKITADGSEVKKVSKETTRALLDVAKAEKERAKAMRDGERIFEATRTKAEKYAAEQKRLNELLKQGAIDQETFNRAMADMKGPSKLRQGINTVATALAGFTAAMGAAVKTSIDFADNIDKASARTGVASKDLTGLKYAAEQSGSSFENVLSALKDMSKTTQTNAQDYKRLGVSIRDANGAMRPQIDILRDIADRFSQLEDGAEKAAIAQKLLGESGLQLIPMLNSGADGIREMTDEAERMGLVMDNETTLSAANLNTNIQRLTDRAKGFANVVMATVLPSLEAYSDAAVEAANNTTGINTTAQTVGKSFVWVIKVFEGVRAAILTVSETIAVAFASIIDHARRQIEALASLARAAVNVMTAVARRDFAGAQSILSSAIAATKNQAKEAVEGQKAIWKGYQESIMDLWEDSARRQEAISEGTKHQIDTTKKAALGMAQEIKKAGVPSVMDEQDKLLKDMEAQAKRIYDSTRTSAEKYAEELNKLNMLQAAGLVDADTYARQLQALADQYDEATIKAKAYADAGLALEKSLMTPLEKYQAEIREINALYDAGVISAETYQRAYERAYSAIEKKVEETAKEVNSFGETAANNVFDAFEDFLFDPFGKSLGEMVQSFAQAMARMSLDAARVQIMSSLFAPASPLPGFAGGGYTGPGGKYEPAGIVHKGEFVFDKESTSKIGASNLMRWMKSARGYSSGGLVGSARAPVSSVGPMAQQQSGANIKIVNVGSGEDARSYLASSEGERVVLNIIGRNTRTVRQMVNG